MRLPIILMLAVIIFTPANIGEVARNALSQAEISLTAFLDGDAAAPSPAAPADTVLVAARQ